MAGGAAPLPSSSKGIFSQRLMEREFYVSFALVTSLFFAWGFAYGLLDVLNKHFQNVLGISKLQSTGLQVAYFGIGYLAFAPVAGEVLKRRGYKQAILMGLALYSTGAILFWPVAKFSVGTTNPQAIFAGFVVLTGLTACGLATLEVTANSYVTVMRPAATAALRLQFSQAFNGVASFSGPLIASKYFFTEGNDDNLGTVQWVYLAVAGLGATLALLFVLIKLPEVSEEELQAQADADAEASGDPAAHAQLAKPFFKQLRPILGFVAQFMYVGAQVAIGTFFINYANESGGYTDSKASQLLSYALIIFTVFRFVATLLLTVFSASFLLLVNAVISALLVALIGSLKGSGGVICLIVVYATMAIQYPVIFVVSTENLGRHTRRAASLLVMGVSGGAVFPPFQGALADAYNTRVSMWVNFVPFIYVALFSAWIWRQKGMKFTRKAEQAVEDERLSHGQVVRETSPVSNEKEKAEDLDQIEYRA
ncbi:major facilitator superfamily domain-containing protein [Mrakia frigida]|uniref:major facilitator superfamily domain-containing protein n=1 Tax=Mrakia frigida TaxID=29902 RepID=UPI003FCBF8F2